MGIVLFNEVVFQEEGLVLVGRSDVFNIFCIGNKQPRFNVLPRRKVRGKPVL